MNRAITVDVISVSLETIKTCDKNINRIRKSAKNRTEYFVRRLILFIHRAKLN
jgi:hypothetical protein